MGTLDKCCVNFRRVSAMVKDPARIMSESWDDDTVIPSANHRWLKNPPHLQMIIPDRDLHDVRTFPS